MATVDVQVETTVRRALAEVSRFAADPDNAPRWYVNITSVRWRTPPPLAVGSSIDFEARFLGRRLAYTYEVVEYVEGASLVMRTADGPFPMETSYRWTAVPDGTRMTLRNRGSRGGFGALAGPFLGLAMRRANRQDLAALKRLLEQASA